MSRITDLSVPASSPHLTGVLDQGCEFEGKLCFHGTVRIGGVFRGNIYTPDTLVVSETARIYGDIDAGTVIINGEVTGTIRAKNRVEIHKPAVFRGDIMTPSLSVDEGVIFEGSNKMAYGKTVIAPAPHATIVPSSR